MFRASQLTQLAFEDLAGRVTGQLVEEDHLSRHLVAGEILLDIRLDRLFVDGRTLGLHHESTQPVPPLFVLHAKGGGLDHLWVAADEVLDLGGEDVLAAAHDHLVVAARYVQQTAFVVKVEGASVDEDVIKAYVKENLARYKVPREVIFLDELPRNPTGKILKRELKDIEIDGQKADAE